MRRNVRLDLARSSAGEATMRPVLPRTVRARATTIARSVLVSLALSAMLNAQPAAAGADAAHRAQVYKTCALCHSFEKNGAGPKHAGLIGRTAGTVPDYRYSP